MSINKGKDRIASLTENTITEVITVVIPEKDTFSKVSEPDEFYGDRKKIHGLMLEDAPEFESRTDHMLIDKNFRHGPPPFLY
jgi:hypothetical protein